MRLIGFESLFCGTVAAVCLFFSDGHAYENGDVQYWNMTQVQKQLTSAWKLLLNYEARWGGNASELYFHRPEVGLAYQVSDRITLSVNYKYLNSKESGAWKGASVPHVNAILNFKWAGLAFMNRHRMEYMGYEDTPHFWRYRGIVYAYLPVYLPFVKSQPYVGDEVIYHMNADRLKYHRIYVGLTTKIGAAIKFDAYYLYHQIRSNDSWSINHIFGSGLTFAF